MFRNFFKTKKPSRQDTSNNQDSSSSLFDGIANSFLGGITEAAGTLSHEKIERLFPEDLHNRISDGPFSIEKLKEDHQQYLKQFQALRETAQENISAAIGLSVIFKQENLEPMPFPHWVAASRRIEELQCLKKEELEQKSNCNSTLLHSAIRYSNLTNACFLLREYPDMAHVESFGRIPMHHAIKVFSVASLKKLQKVGMDFTVRDKEGYSMIHWRYKERFRFILDKDSRMRERTFWGFADSELEDFLLPINNNQRFYITPKIDPYTDLKTAEELEDVSEWETEEGSSRRSSISNRSSAEDLIIIEEHSAPHPILHKKLNPYVRTNKVEDFGENSAWETDSNTSTSNSSMY